MTDDYGDLLPQADPEAAGLPALLRKRQAVTAAIAGLEAQLGEARKALAEIDEDHLPAALDKLSVHETVLGDVRLRLRSKVYCTLPAQDQERRAACLAWLAENGHGDMVKDRVELLFPRGKAALVEWLLRSLRHGYGDEAEVHRESWVEPQTLLARARKIHEAGGAMPESFGFFARRIVEVVPAKRGRGRTVVPAGGQNDEE